MRVLAALLAAAALAGSAPRAGGAATVRARFLMGTTLRIEIPAGAPEVVYEAAFAEVARLEDVLSNWRETSEVSRLNRHRGAPFRCSDDLFAALRAALHWAAETGGAFDPTVEPLVKARGLRGSEGILPAGAGSLMAAPAAVEAPARASGAGEAGGTGGPDPAVGWSRVRLDPEDRTATLTAPSAGIDFGGIGKGMALDAAVARLRAGGVTAALLDFGGQVAALGPPPGRRAWRIGIAEPEDRGREAGGVRIRNASAATSGNSERGGGQAGGHILDPASGRPAAFAGSVTVVAREATAADALSTALFVMGPEAGLAWAEARGVAALFLRRDGGGGLERRVTGAFERLVDDADPARDTTCERRAAGRRELRVAPRGTRPEPRP